jgi:hypothetical protein
MFYDQFCWLRLWCLTSLLSIFKFATNQKQKIVNVGHVSLRMKKKVGIVVKNNHIHYLYQLTNQQTPRYNWNIVESGVKHHNKSLMMYVGSSTGITHFVWVWWKTWSFVSLYWFEFVVMLPDQDRMRMFSREPQIQMLVPTYKSSSFLICSFSQTETSKN